MRHVAAAWLLRGEHDVPDRAGAGAGVGDARRHRGAGGGDDLPGGEDVALRVGVGRDDRGRVGAVADAGRRAARVVADVAVTTMSFAATVVTLGLVNAALFAVAAAAAVWCFAFR